MAATVQVDESNGSGETITTNVSRGDWLSADLAGTSDLRTANAIAVPGAGSNYSYEKYHKLQWVSGTATQLDTFRHYYSGASGYPGTGLTLRTSAQSGTPSNATYAQPVNTVSSKADQAFPSADPAVATISGTLTGTTQKTGYVVTQLEVASTTTAGFLLNNVYRWLET